MYYTKRTRDGIVVTLQDKSSLLCKPTTWIYPALDKLCSYEEEQRRAEHNERVSEESGCNSDYIPDDTPLELTDTEWDEIAEELHLNGQ